MSKDLKKVESVLSDQQKQALNVLIQAVNISAKNGVFELDDAVVIGNAKNLLKDLLEE
jgi:hypothetical protein